MKNEYKKCGSVETRVIEECSEVIHILCKIDRFGYDNYHPENPRSSNKELLIGEILDLKTVLQELEHELGE